MELSRTWFQANKTNLKEITIVYQWIMLPILLLPHLNHQSCQLMILMHQQHYPLITIWTKAQLLNQQVHFHLTIILIVPHHQILLSLLTIIKQAQAHHLQLDQMTLIAQTPQLMAETLMVHCHLHLHQLNHQSLQNNQMILI